jgi:molybdopterin-guanine dinucleotide biosynthesis protein A
VYDDRVVHTQLVSGVVLVGGASRRFGSPKTDLFIAGEHLLERTLRLLEEVLELSPIQVGSPTHPDRRPGQGPLAGIESALELVTTPTAIVVACDMPGLSKELLTLLASAPDREDVLVPLSHGQTHPLCARWHRRCLPVIQESLDNDVRSVHRVLDRLNTRYLPEAELLAAGVEPQQALWNINRRDDLEAFLEAHRS